LAQWARIELEKSIIPPIQPLKIILRISWVNWKPVEDSRPKTDLLREVVGMPLESPRFPVSLWGSEGGTQVEAGVVGLEESVE